MADGGVEGHIERGNGLKVSALIPGLRVPDSNTGQVNVLYSWAIHLTFTVPLSSQEYSTGKLSGKPDKMLGGNLWMDWHFIQGGVVILLVPLCYMETRIRLSWVGQ